MKQRILFLALLLATTAQAQNNYAEAIQQGDAALRRGQYKTAINKYFAAEAFDPSKKAVVQGKVNGVFDKIEALRAEADRAKRQAEDALVQVEEEQGKTRAALELVTDEQAKIQVALAETEKAKLRADSALAKANKLVDAFYFYADRFALAFKDDRFYFIDKNGDPVKKLGEWEKAEQFDGRGFAKINKRNDAKPYLLDTLGNTYLVAYAINDLKPDITALSLSGKLMFNPIPEEVLQQESLEVLLLDFNFLNHLPPQFYNLKKLTFLDLSTNILGSLPPEIGNLTKLTALILNSTGLITLPREIGNLTKLTHLDLGSNQLHNLPAEIGKLTNLSTLDLSFSTLTYLPAEIGNLTNLTYLDLGNNISLFKLPPEIRNLTKLTTLIFNNNSSLTSLPREIFDLTNLNTLILDFNMSVSSIPPEIGKLANLTKLSLQFNKLHNLPSEIKNLTKLVSP